MVPFREKDNMPQFLKTLFGSSTVRKAFVSLVLAVAAALGYSQLGCAALTPAKQARVDMFVCRAKVLEPVVGDVLDAQELVRDVYAGRASLSSVLSARDVTEAEAQALVAAFSACSDVPKGQAL